MNAEAEGKYDMIQPLALSVTSDIVGVLNKNVAYLRIIYFNNDDKQYYKIKLADL